MTTTPENKGDRRTADAALLALIQTIHDDIKKLDERVIGLDSRLTKHITDETMEIAQELHKLMKDAFPEGDPTGHRKHHEAVIAKAEARAEFWKKLSFEISKGGLLGFLTWALYALWQYFLQGPHK